MLDTVVPSIPNNIKRLASLISEFNLLLHQFLPLTRQAELLEYERDLRVRQSTAWNYVHDWVLEGLDTFITQSLRLLDVFETHHSSRKTTGEVTQLVYEAAVIIGDRCQCGRNHTRLISRIYDQLGGVLKRYAENPIPQADLNGGFIKTVTNIIAGVPHTSPETFARLISLADQIRLGSEQVNTALDDLTEFFGKLTDQFSKDELNASWAAKLDVRSLRERWGRLHEVIVRGKGTVEEAEAMVARLDYPLSI